MTASVTNHLPTIVPSTWDESADVIIVGYGFAGAAAADSYVRGTLGFDSQPKTRAISSLRLRLSVLSSMPLI